MKFNYCAAFVFLAMQSTILFSSSLESIGQQILDFSHTITQIEKFVQGPDAGKDSNIASKSEDVDIKDDTDMSHSSYAISDESDTESNTESDTDSDESEDESDKSETQSTDAQQEDVQVQLKNIGDQIEDFDKQLSQVNDFVVKYQKQIKPKVVTPDPEIKITPAKTKTTPVASEQVLPEQGIVNLIIANDCNDTVIDGAIANTLLNALSENQLVLTTIKLYNNLLLSYENYKSKDSFMKNYKLLQDIAQKNHANIDMLHAAIVKLSKDKFKSGVHEKLAAFTLFSIFLQHNYTCKQVTDDYILFIPQGLITAEKKRNVQSRLKEQFKEKVAVKAEDLVLGLSTSMLSDFDYKKPVTCEKIQDVEHEHDYCISCDENNVVAALAILSLVTVGPDNQDDEGNIILPYVEKILKKKKVISADIARVVTPKMNIYLNGHGWAEKAFYEGDNQPQVAGIIAEGENNFFQAFLSLLQESFVMQTLTINTCFVGKTMYNLQNDLEKKSLFEYLSYPIIVASTLNSMSSGFAPHLTISTDITKQDVQNSLYQVGKKHFYGPKKLANGKGMFEQFFLYLNNYQRYDVPASKFSEAYSYTAYRPEYSKAIDVVMNVFDEDGKIDRLENITSVKLPGTSWVSAPELDKRMKRISKTQGLTAKGGIVIPQTVSVVLLETPYVKYPITVKATGDQEWVIIPSIIADDVVTADVENEDKPGNQVYYYLEEFTCNTNINELGRAFLDNSILDYSSQTFSLVIGKATCANKTYSDVLIEYSYTPDESYYSNDDAANDQDDASYTGEENYTLNKIDEVRFGQISYKDPKSGKLKEFVYKGRKMYQESTVEEYEELVKKTKKNALNAIGAKKEVVDNLEGKLNFKSRNLLAEAEGTVHNKALDVMNRKLQKSHSSV